MPPTSDTAPSRRLTRAERRVIREAYATGEVTLEALATLFGISRQAVHQLVTYETWKKDAEPD
jgi:predicted DNA binding protein